MMEEIMLNSIPWELMKFLSNDQIIKVMEVKDFVSFKPVTDEDVFDLKKFKKLRCEMLSEKTTEVIFKYLNHNVGTYNNVCEYLCSNGELNMMLENILEVANKSKDSEVIVSDALFEHLGFYGYTYDKTLHYDRIRSDEMYVKRCYINDKGKAIFKKMIFKLYEV
jgi:hypothetical protein